jgi:hypothetical protein
MELTEKELMKELGIDDEDTMRKVAIAAIISQMSKETVNSLKEITELNVKTHEKEMCTIVFLSAYAFGRRDAEKLTNPAGGVNEESIEQIKKFIEDNNLI